MYPSHIGRVNPHVRFTLLNVTPGNRAKGENPGYYYAPCEGCGKRQNVGNNPLLTSLNRYGVWGTCCEHKIRHNWGTR